MYDGQSESLNSNSPVTLIKLKLVWRSVSLFFQSNRCGLKKMNRRTVKRGPSLSLQPFLETHRKPLTVKAPRVPPANHHKQTK